MIRSESLLERPQTWNILPSNSELASAFAMGLSNVEERVYISKLNPLQSNGEITLSVSQVELDAGILPYISRHFTSQKIEYNLSSNPLAGVVLHLRLSN